MLAEKFAYPTKNNVAWREALPFFLLNTLLTPRDIKFGRSIFDNENSVTKAERLLKEGYSLIIPITHFSLRDTLDVFSCLPISDEIIKRPIEVPVAWHQYYDPKLHKLFKLVSSKTGVVFDPIVNQDTIDKGLNFDPLGKITEPLKLGYGHINYLKNARNSLNNQGIVVVSPQAGRREKMELITERPIEMIIHKNVNDLDKVAFMFLPISLANEKLDYKKADGFNPFRRYNVEIGPTYTYKELKKIYGQMGVTLDELVSIILSCGVSPKYNGIEAGLQKKYQEVIDKLST